jgi:hypothetical protein
MKISDVAKRVILTIGILAAVLVAASVGYYRSSACLPFVFGVLLGAGVGIAKVFMLERTIDRVLEMDKKAAENYAHLHHMLRLLLSGGALVLAALVPGISLWGAAAGIMTYQIGVYMMKFTKKS